MSNLIDMSPGRVLGRVVQPHRDLCNAHDASYNVARLGGSFHLSILLLPRQISDPQSLFVSSSS